MAGSAASAPRVLIRLAQLLVALVLWAPATALARNVPPLVAHVNDTADMLSPAAEQALEQKLTAYEQKSQHQFALLTIDSLEGDAIEEFSMRVVEAWKLGRKGKDDGLLLLIAKADHKLRIEVGYGLEGDVTDAFSAQVRRNVLTPALRADQAEQGIDRAFDVLMKKAGGEVVPESAVAPPRSPRRPPITGMIFLGLVLLLFGLPVLLPLISGRVGTRRNGFFTGGGFGGGGFGGGGGWGGGGFGGGGGGGGFGGGGGGFGGGGSSGSW
jgi:uncharacterized protein